MMRALQVCAVQHRRKQSPINMPVSIHWFFTHVGAEDGAVASQGVTQLKRHVFPSEKKLKSSCRFKAGTYSMACVSLSIRQAEESRCETGGKNSLQNNIWDWHNCMIWHGRLLLANHTRLLGGFRSFFSAPDNLESLNQWCELYTNTFSVFQGIKIIFMSSCLYIKEYIYTCLSVTDEINPQLFATRGELGLMR